MALSEDEKVKLDALHKLAVHLSDCLGAANEAIAAGAITQEQWRRLFEAIPPLWDKFEQVTGKSVHVMAAEMFAAAREKDGA
jgi:tape measure domain-containing protein